ncbi:MAG: glycoside hydrolase family 16 protein [Petrimonas sp.]|nr:glycoside hydrolase family 16 protein [Petrimonas sp.]
MKIYPFLILSIFFIVSSASSCDKEKVLVDEPKEAFRDDFNGTTVDESLWTVATWNEHGGQTGRERVYVKDGYLHMIFKNDNGTFLSSAVQSKNEFLYGRWEARLKPSFVPGVLNSFYTIDWNDVGSGDGTKQEIDIEFLTQSFGKDKGEVHFAVHAEGLKSFNTNPDIVLDFNPSDDFHVWGFDVKPDKIEWFVDGKVLHTYYYTDHEVKITDPYQLKLNCWSQNGQWIQGPPPSGVECVYLIDWIRFIPYE